MVFVLFWREARLMSGEMGGDHHQVVEWDRTNLHPTLEALNGKPRFLQGYVTKIGSSTLRDIMVY